jgi:hypothetical protein
MPSHPSALECLQTTALFRGKSTERLSVKMQPAVLTTVANEFRARYEPAEAMPPAITALLKQLHQSQDNDQ